MKIQRRYSTTQVEGATVRGVAVPFNSPSKPLRDMPERGTYREIFTRDSIRDRGDHVALYVGHDPQQVPVARVGSGTLRFNRTENGLEFEADISPARTDIIDALKRNDLPGASIGFRMVQDQWITKSKPATRMVRAADLFELSLVVSPAYEAAQIEGIQ